MNDQIIEIGDLIKLKFSNSMFGIVIDKSFEKTTIFYYVFTIKNQVRTYTGAFLEIVTKRVINE